MSSPDTSFDPCLWVLKAAHELFHIYQNAILPKNLFQKQYVNNDDLNFPFNYKDESIAALGQIEAIFIFDKLKKKQWSVTDTIDIKRFFDQDILLSKHVFPDSLQIFYKQLQEWKEGVARYTKRELACLTADISYNPSASFLHQFKNNYKKVWEDNYDENNIFNPLRFVYKGVQGRVIFYYVGLVKAYLLERFDSSWKKDYLTSDLDSLLILKSTP